MSSEVTLVVLTPEPLDCPKFAVGAAQPMTVLNHVSTFNDAAGLLRENIAAIRQVKTPWFCLHDWDDPLPVFHQLPASGILYGDYIYKSKGTGWREAVMPTPNWTADKHLQNFLFIHRAVCKTEDALKILPLLPEGEFLYFFLLYFLLADNFGVTYDPFFWSCWNKGDTGMHKQVGNARRNTHAWLLAHRAHVKQFLSSNNPT